MGGRANYRYTVVIKNDFRLFPENSILYLDFVYLLLVGAGDVALEVFLEVPRERVPRDSISRSSISLPDISCTEINARQLDNMQSLVNSPSDNIPIIYRFFSNITCNMNEQPIELFNQSK